MSSAPDIAPSSNEQQLRINKFLQTIRNINQIGMRADDLQEAAQQICESLMNMGGHHYVWITLTDSNGHPVHTTGVGPNSMADWLAAQSGMKQLPVCAQRALAQAGTVIINNPAVECNGCPMLAGGDQFCALSTRLAYRDELYGVMVISMPPRPHHNFENHEFYRELAGDVSTALYNVWHRKNCRQAQEGAEQVNQIFESTLDEIYIFDAETLQFIEVNQGARQNLGYSSDELRQMIALDLKPEITRQKFDAIVAPLRKQEQDEVHFYTVHRRKDGSLYPVEVHLQRLTWHNRPVFLAIAMDITARKKIEAEIQRKNRELALLNRVISASAANLNLEEILEIVCRELALFFEVPQAAAALLNTQKTKAVVRAEYLAPGRPSGLGYQFPVAGNPVFDYLFAHKTPLVIDNTRHDPRIAAVREMMQARGTVSMLLVPLMVDDEVVGSLGIDALEPRTFSPADVNLTHRVATQLSGPLALARLVDRQRRLVTAIEQSAEGVIITDLAANIIYVNPAIEKTTGYSAAELIGQNPRILKSGVQDQAFYQAMWDTLTAGQVWHGQFVNKRKNGKLYTDESTITPVCDEKGTVVSYVAVQRDITAELSLREQYYQAQKMESLGRLTGGVAHDFNNMLTAINGFAELMKMRMAANDPLLPMVENILRSGNRAVSLVKQLLVFSRKQTIKPEVINPNQVITDLDKMLHRIIGEDIEFKTIMAPDCAMINIDPTQLEQVLVNLVVNARDAMPYGGKITIETKNVTLDEGYAATHFGAATGDYVLLAVSDTGPGIPEKIMPHIFDPFFTTKEQGKGSGLGLATVHGIVKQNNGDVRVYSEVGVGTTFKVYLPVTHSTAATNHRASVGVVKGGNETILLVEDDEAVRSLVERMLEGLGYRVFSAANGAEALQLARQHQNTLDLMLTDVVMPDMSGKKVAEKILAELPELNVLYMSGYTDNAIAHHNVLDAGFAYIAKPFSLSEISKKLREVLDG